MNGDKVLADLISAITQKQLDKNCRKPHREHREHSVIPEIK